MNFSIAVIVIVVKVYVNILKIERMKKMDEAEMLKKLCQPIINWLEKDHDPYTQVQVSIDSIEMVQKTIGIPIKKDG